jgi:hypothetical protein
MVLEKHVKIKWTDRITNDEVFRRAKRERLHSKLKKKIDVIPDRAYN